MERRAIAVMGMSAVLILASFVATEPSYATCPTTSTTILGRTDPCPTPPPVKTYQCWRTGVFRTHRTCGLR